MSGITYQQPIFLLLMVLPLLGAYFLITQKDRIDVKLRLSDTSSVASFWNFRTILYKILPWIKLLSLSFFIIALARPQKVWQDQDIKSDGIDIALVMDISYSMMAQDFTPDRLEVSKQVASQFVEDRPYDRFSLTLFSGDAFSPCPLTTDHRVVRELLSKIKCEFIEKKGTSIGMGLASAINRVKNSESKTKIIILLTDGAEKPSYLQASQAAEIAKALGIKIYTIGIGTEDEVLMPIGKQDDGEYVYGYAVAEFDEQLLINTAQTTGGRYFKASDRNSLQSIYKEIDKLEKSPIKISSVKREKDYFSIFLTIGLIQLLLVFLLRSTILRTVT